MQKHAQKCWLHILYLTCYFNMVKNIVINIEHQPKYAKLTLRASQSSSSSIDVSSVKQSLYTKLSALVSFKLNIMLFFGFSLIKVMYFDYFWTSFLFLYFVFSHLLSCSCIQIMSMFLSCSSVLWLFQFNSCSTDLIIYQPLSCSSI